MDNPLSQIIAAQKQGRAVGMYSICSANWFVLEAAILQAKSDDTPVLIESTSNQVDQFGGYSGMTPDQFAIYVREIAKAMDFPFEKVILGGDHLGPNVWQEENAKNAMEKARELVRSCVLAGFRKIHLDTSMRCADDPGDSKNPLDARIVAERTAELCVVAEAAFAERPAGSQIPFYVIGTDVPVPGGAQEKLTDVMVTRAEDVEQTIEVTKQAFISHGLQSAWERVIAIVVQPGVEFSNVSVIEYDREKAKHLSEHIEKYNNLIYEAHSTDYQKKEALRHMVEDHFAILKVGPWLTFAFREAVFALADMEVEWLSGRKGITISRIREVLDKAMRNNPEHWQKHYHGDESYLSFARKYSYSDRSRYYWSNPAVVNALNMLLDNMADNPVPLSLLSQYMPVQYQAVREGRISNTPIELIRDRIKQVTEVYAYACGLN